MSDEKPPSEVPWFLNSSINLAIGSFLGGVAGIFVTLCRLGIVCVNFIAEDWTPGMVGVFVCVAAVVWAKRRIKLGKDPNVPLAKITSGLPTNAKP